MPRLIMVIKTELVYFLKPLISCQMPASPTTIATMRMHHQVGMTRFGAGISTPARLLASTNVETLPAVPVRSRSSAAASTRRKIPTVNPLRLPPLVGFFMLSACDIDISSRVAYSRCCGLLLTARRAYTIRAADDLGGSHEDDDHTLDDADDLDWRAGHDLHAGSPAAQEGEQQRGE